MADRPPHTDPERRRWLRNKEDEFATLVRVALTGVVVGAWSKFAAGRDVAALDTIPHAWTAALTEQIIPAAGDVYLAGNVAAWDRAPAVTETAGRLFEQTVNRNAAAYMDATTKRLTPVGDSVWQAVKAKTATALEQNLSVEDLKGQIEAVTRFSEFRADTIARTQLNQAYVQGELAGNRALGSAGPTTKTWTATEDARTREDHSDADGQTVGMDELFEVGDEEMDAPLDPSASAAQTANCRCYLVYGYPADGEPGPTDDSPPDHPSIDDDALNQAAQDALDSDDDS